jgi:YhcH/YjgK/YiaL family protein
MIYDVFANGNLYFGKKDAFGKALDFAMNFDRSKPDGKYEIDGSNLYALVMSYQTRSAEEARFEAHKKYIDIQLLLDGQEFADVCLNEKLEVDTPFSEENDAALYKSPKFFTSVLLTPGRFAIFYPGDIHRPCRMIDSSKPVRKMVLKVRV